MIKETPSAAQKQSILLCIRCHQKNDIQNRIVTFLLCDSNGVINETSQVSEIRWVSDFSFLDSADNLTMYSITADYIELKT